MPHRRSPKRKTFTVQEANACLPLAIASPYRDMFFYLPFSSYTVNSLVVAGASTILTLAMGSLAGFAFARFIFPGKRLVLLVFLLSQMLPGASVIIPLFQLVTAAGLYDTLIGLVLVAVIVVVVTKSMGTSVVHR